MRPESRPSALLAIGLVLAALPARGDLLVLGERQFTCKKGELRLHGDSGSTRYPGGKREKLRVPTKAGILSYTCHYVRSSVSCPMNTTVVTVRHGSYSGQYEVECLGETHVGAPVSGDSPVSVPVGEAEEAEP